MKLRETLSAIVILVSVCVGISACGLFTSQNAKSALEISQMACALYQSAEGQDKGAIMTICRIDSVLAPELEKLLAAKRQEVAMRRAGACGPDAGAP